jgi:membrane protein implicated in regulation of membrane protease activity
MFILHGHYDRERPQGMVADKCDYCGEVTLFQLTQHFRVPHVYFIPLGKGDLIDSVLECTECGRRAATRLVDYVRVIPEKQARTLSLAEIMEETNPRLAELAAALAQLDQARGEGSADDPRFEEATAKLWDFGPREPAWNHFLPRLSKWATLEAAAQDRLLRELDERWREHQQRQARLQFIRTMAESFKPDVDGFLAALTFFLVFIGGFVLSAVSLPQGALCAGFALSLIGALVSAVLVHRAWRRRKHRAFFRTKWLPQAELRGLDPVGLAEELAVIPVTDAKSDKSLRGLRDALPLLVAVMEEDTGMPVVIAPAAKRRELGDYPEDPLLFLQRVVKDYKEDVDGLLPFLTMFVLAVGGLILALALLPEGAAQVVGILLALAGAIVGTVLVHGWLRRRRIRRFFRATLLPEARQRGVDLTRAVEILQGLQGTKSDVDHPLHALARSLPLLVQVMEKEGVYAEPRL